MNLKPYLLPTQILDSDHPDIISYAKEAVGTVKDPTDMAVKLYYAVRDPIWYDPYSPFYLPIHYQASAVLKKRRGFCINKAALLCALARACNIPSRVGFATVRNHLSTRQLIEYIGSDLFVYHGYTEFYLENKWVKATPAFNAELCIRHKVLPLEFDGREDSVFQPYNSENRKYMEYVEHHGEYADIPVNEIVAAWKKVYGEERVNRWIETYEKAGTSTRNFYKEEVL
jgi:transglutaminase-like putative cysteine protease